MKNLNLSLIVLLFSSLLMGCGMKGPLYRVNPQVEHKEYVVDKKEDNNVADIKH